MLNNQKNVENLEASQTIFENPPINPIPLVQQWHASALTVKVLDPNVLAFATANAIGHASNRIVQMLKIRDDGILFTSHSQSQKGIEISETGWASAVLYWREIKQQIILSGYVEQLSAIESDILWQQRPASTYPMSIVSKQSDTLIDANILRQQAQQLLESGAPLLRPKTWHGYLLTPITIEFWQAAADRLHHRLRYDFTVAGWSNRRLQP